MKSALLPLSLLFGLFGSPSLPAQAPPSGLISRFAAGASASGEAAYPRPLMVRPEWQSLNGPWEFALAPADQPRPEEFPDSILVPFPVESKLSGVTRRVAPTERAWYRRAFDVPGDWQGREILLHFGAVDWHAEVWVNGQRLGEHRGGYDPFSFDITFALNDLGGQELVVAVSDPTDAGTQPRGKQVQQPNGIWYTPSTGIWQTVWIEPVPPAGRIDALRITPDVDRGILRVAIDPELAGAGAKLDVRVHDGEGAAIARARGTTSVELELDRPHLWSPGDPFLYDLEIELHQGAGGGAESAPVDRVSSYCGFRKIEVRPDAAGRPRILLNGEPLFQLGLLDQGFWPGGLYTAPTDEALSYDVEVTRRLGFNMIRKHVKVEPARWYTHCDRLGLLVWQDMPSGDGYIGGADPDLLRTAESAAQYELELERIIDSLSNHPSIVMWVPFNEGWGQFDTGRIAERVKAQDPTRLVDSASGWTDRGVGDVRDVHAYPGPGMGSVEPVRAQVLGEFGGLGMPLAGHTWQAEKNWGYRSFTDRERLTDAYVKLIEELRFLIPEGLSAAVYTQTTDVEIEVNGVMTYDREIIKLDPERVLAANRSVHRPPPRVETLLADARSGPALWRFSTLRPAEGWEQPGFDDSGWSEGPAGFGRDGTPGAVVRTDWHTGDIWMRREFELPRRPDPDGLRLSIHHDEDADVYLNGAPAARLAGYTTGYVRVPLEAGASPRAGRNTLAIHCRQTGGGQYLDAGLVSVTGQRPPNIVLVFTDDQGYGDAGVQIQGGAREFETPHLDALAAQGVRFTSFYVAQPVCSASRTGLLTGCYPNRLGITGALGPKAKHGIHHRELTLAELCRSKGYRTAAFGKWHLGHHRRFLPRQHGFDEYFGIPYSNDMWPKHPENPKDWPDLPLIEGDGTVATNPDQRRFTTGFTDRAVEFIERCGDEPFFLYVAHPMPHVPLFVSEATRAPGDRSARGLYGDVIEEIDDSVGRILAALDETGVAGDTLVIFTSDNGPWLSYGDHAGSAGPLREGKGTTFEGGVRVPCIMRWPGRIPPGSIAEEPAMTIDILPTVAKLLEADLPDWTIDGRDIWPLISGRPGARSPHEAYYLYYHRNDLEAVRSGRWKLHFPHAYRTMIGREPGAGGIPGQYDHSVRTGLELYDLEADLGESKNVAAEHPDVVHRLSELADRMRADLGDDLTGATPTGRRPPGQEPDHPR